MEWLPIILEIAGAVGKFVLEALKAGSLEAALDRPLRDILPHELRTTIAKRLADEAAAKKFGTP